LKRQIFLKNSTFNAFRNSFVLLLKEEKEVGQKPFEPPDTVELLKEDPMAMKFEYFAAKATELSLKDVNRPFMV